MNSDLISRVSVILARVFLFMSSLTLVAIMCVTVVEVIGRYIFNAPIFGRQDIAQILLALSIFCAFPVVTLRKEQIDVDLLDDFFGKKSAYFRDRAIELLVSICLLTMGYWLYLRAEKVFSRGIVSELLFIPKFPLVYFIAFIVFTTGIIVFLLFIARTLRPKKADKNQPEDAA